jgi:ethanolamine utilization protein EutN
MHFGRVIGTVVATVKTPGLAGHRLLVVQPTDSRAVPTDEPAFVAVDLVSAAPGQWVFFVRAREAANALPDKFNPVDATIMGIVDVVDRLGERIRG